MITQDQLKKSYLNWLNTHINLKDLDGIIEVSTPFLDRNNDHLQIYVIPGKNRLRLTDDSYIISDLIMSGCDVKSTKKRKEIFQTILNGYGVSFDPVTDELYVEANLENYPQKKHMLLQAMLSINDMFMTSRNNVSSIFLEDVEQFFIENEIIYTEQVNFIGKSGFTHKFDFVLPRMKNRPERLISAINNPTRDKASSLLFAWGDTRQVRKNDATLYTIINDVEKVVSADVITALEQYDVRTVLWSQRKQYLPELIA